MKLYYNPLSTYSQKAMIAFNEKGLTYEPALVDLTSEEGRTAFLQVSPLGKVPFLRASDDWAVPESTIIIEYLEDRFPQTTRLIPQSDPEAARQVRFIDRLADLYFNEPVSELLFQQFGFREKNEQRATRAQRDIATTYQHWDKRLATRPWLCGEQFTMADCAAIPPLFYAQMLVPFTQHSHLAAYWQRAQKRPSYVKVRAEFEPIWNGMIAAKRVA